MRWVAQHSASARPKHRRGARPRLPGCRCRLRHGDQTGHQRQGPASERLATRSKTLLVHEDVAPGLLPALAARLGLEVGWRSGATQAPQRLMPGARAASEGAGTRSISTSSWQCAWSLISTQPSLTSGATLGARRGHRDQQPQAGAPFHAGRWIRGRRAGRCIDAARRWSQVWRWGPRGWDFHLACARSRDGGGDGTDHNQVHRKGDRQIRTSRWPSAFFGGSSTRSLRASLDGRPGLRDAKPGPAHLRACCRASPQARVRAGPRQARPRHDRAGHELRWPLRRGRPRVAPGRAPYTVNTLANLSPRAT